MTYGRLENGLRYAILPERDETGTVSIQLNISAGWNDEPEDAYGVAHLLEHIAFRSKREKDDTSIIHDLQSNGVEFGRDFNGYTTDDDTYYLITLTKPSAKDISNALTGLKEMTEVSALSSETLAVEKKIVLAELNQRNSIQDKARQSSFAFENPLNARARVKGIGTAGSLEDISLQHVEQFHHTHYRPENSLIILVGDVDLHGARDLIKSKFSKWQKGNATASPSVEVDDGESETLPEPRSFRKSAAKSELRAIQHTPSTLGNDLLQNRRSAFIDRIVTSTFQARLSLRIEDEPKVSWMTAFKKQALTHDVKGVKMGAKDYEIGYTIFEEERRRLIQYGLTDEEFKFAFDKKRADFRQAAQPGKLINASAVASRMRRNFINGDVYNNSQQHLEIFETFEASITKEDLEQSAKQTWTDFTPKYWTQSSASMKGVIKDVMAVRDTIKEDDINPPLESSDTIFKSAIFSKIGEIKSRDYVKSEETHRLLFENGARLNFKANDQKKNEILVAISLKPQDEMFLKYYSAIAEKLPSLSWADISGMDKLTMERQFVGQHVRFNAGLFEDRFIFLISTKPDDLQDSLEIASTFLVNFDLESKDHIRRFEKRLRNQKNSMRSSPLQSGSIKLPSTYADDPPAFKSNQNNGYFIEAHRDAEIKKIIETGSIEVGIVGDFDDDAVINIFSKTIGAMPNRPAVRADHLYTDPSITHKPPSVETITYAGSSDQMALMYCWPSLPDLDANETAQLQILSNVILNRFHEHIRQDLGLTYGANILAQNNRVFPRFGYLCFSAQIESENEAVTLVGFGSVVESIYDTPITKSEFDRARKPLMSLGERYDSNNASTTYALARAYSDELYWGSVVKWKKALESVELSSMRTSVNAVFNSSERSIFRVQHFQSSRVTHKNTLLAKSYIGDPDSQFTLGVNFLSSRVKAERERGIEFLQSAGESGKTEAYLELGRYYGQKKEFKLASTHLESAEGIPEGAYLLSTLYFQNFKAFPDVPDDRIIELAKRSAEAGVAKGQLFFAERLKDGTLTKRDEIGALKWALIANHLQFGELKLFTDKQIERFQTGLEPEDVAQATQAAKAWVQNNPK